MCGTSAAEPDGFSTDQLVEEHLDLVGRITRQFCARYPQHVDRSDIWSAGAAGLVDAARKFDPSLGVPFQPYASIRIRGAIIDWTRTYDWASRRTRRRARVIEEARESVRHDLGTEPTLGQVADRARLDVEEVARIAEEVERATLLSLDAPTGFVGTYSMTDVLVDGDEDRDPTAHLESVELTAMLRMAVELLDERSRHVVVEHFLEGRTMWSVAEDIGVTEARVSQIVSEALLSLRVFFERFGHVEDTISDSEGPGRRRRAAYRERADSLHWQQVLSSVDA